MVSEIAMKYYPASVYGCVIMIDVASSTIRHILQFRPYLIMNLVHTWQNGYPMRFQKINIFNSSPLLNLLWPRK